MKPNIFELCGQGNRRAKTALPVCICCLYILESFADRLHIMWLCVTAPSDPVYFSRTYKGILESAPSRAEQCVGSILASNMPAQHLPVCLEGNKSQSSNQAWIDPCAIRHAQGQGDISRLKHGEATEGDMSTAKEANSDATKQMLRLRGSAQSQTLQQVSRGESVD